MNEYLQANSLLTHKILDFINDVQNIEQQMDRLYKVNLYLLRRYKDDLIKEFNIEIPENIFNDPWFKLLEATFNDKVDYENETLILSLITTKIEEEMKKEMPEPWYCYSFGNINNN